MFASFGLGGLFLGLVVIPLTKLFSPNEIEQSRRSQKTIHSWMKTWLWFMNKIGVADFELTGAEKIPEDKGCLLVANHPSLIDIVILFSMYPQATCIVKKALWENTFLKHIVSAAGYIPNDKGEVTLQHCRKALDRGDTLIIFPEGTRTKPNQELDLKRGASQVALRLECKVRLAHIKVEPTTLTKGEKWYAIPPRRPKFSVKIGEKVDPKEFLEGGKPVSLAARHFTSALKERLEVAKNAM